MRKTGLLPRRSWVNSWQLTRKKVFSFFGSHVRERIRNFYSRYTTRAHQEELKQEVTDELRAKKLLTGDIPDDLFREAILTIKKEAVYLHTILPRS